MALSPVFLVVVAIFEIVCWTVDPFGVHTALNGGKPMEVQGAAAAAAVNSVPLLILAYSVIYDKQWLKAVFFPFLATFVCMQTVFWWQPYFFGIVDAHMLDEHVEQMKNLPRLLPPMLPYKHIIPDNEHLILFPISVLTLLLTVLDIFKQKSSSLAPYFLSTCIGSIPLVASYLFFEKQTSPGARNAFAAIAIVISLVNILQISAGTDKKEERKKALVEKLKKK